MFAGALNRLPTLATGEHPLASRPVPALYYTRQEDLYFTTMFLTPPPTCRIIASAAHKRAPVTTRYGARHPHLWRLRIYAYEDCYTATACAFGGSSILPEHPGQRRYRRSRRRSVSRFLPQGAVVRWPSRRARSTSHALSNTAAGRAHEPTGRQPDIDCEGLEEHRLRPAQFPLQLGGGGNVRSLPAGAKPCWAGAAEPSRPPRSTPDGIRAGLFLPVGSLRP